MTDKQLITQLLVSEACRAKALVKYEIRQLESRLKRYLTCGIETVEVVEVCQLLSQHYDEYLQMLLSNDATHLLYKSIGLHCLVWRDCYMHIELLKKQLLAAVTNSEEAQKVYELCWHYRHFHALLDQNATQSAQESKEVVWYETIKQLLKADSPAMWLEAMVYFANQSAAKSAEPLMYLTKLTDQQLLNLSTLFNQQEYIHIISAIFFYKLHPQDLFNEVLHPEKLVSLKVRLSLLYDGIEVLSQSILQTLIQRGFPIEQDYLFHSEELPQGIEIIIGDDSRNLIQSEIKSCCPNAVLAKDNRPQVTLVSEMLRVYKYWFNPSRMVDAAMLLHQGLMKQSPSAESDGGFYKQMLTIYSQLTTTECLDLYGYFSNKDTCYLMRTLMAVNSGVVFSWLPSLTVPQKNAVKHVYDTLECVMNALLAELANRSIATTPYNRDLTAKITPRRRNCNAVKRILALYGKEVIKTINPRIEELFNAVDGS